VEEWFIPVELAWCHGIGSHLQALNPHATIYFDLGYYTHAEISGDTPRDFDSPNATQFILKTKPDRRQAIGLCSYRGSIPAPNSSDGCERRTCRGVVPCPVFARLVRQR
jgi:hypothetical protein